MINSLRYFLTMDRDTSKIITLRWKKIKLTWIVIYIFFRRTHHWMQATQLPWLHIKLNLAKYSPLNLGNPRNPGIKRKYTEHLQLQKLSIIKSLTWLLYIECNLKVLLWLTTSKVIMLTIYVLTQISPETTLTFNTWWKKKYFAISTCMSLFIWIIVQIFFSEFFQNPCITHYDTLFTVKHGFMLIPHTASLIIIIRKI